MVTPSLITSWTVTGGVSPSAGVGRFAPFPFTETEARPVTPDRRFAAVIPSGIPSAFLYRKPVVPLVRQHGLVPQMLPGGITVSMSGCPIPDES